MRTAADLAERFASGQLRTTGMQNVVIVNVPQANSEPLARELEGGHVVLHPRVPGGQGRRAQQAHGSVGRDQASAGPRLSPREQEQSRRPRRGDKGQEPSHGNTSLSRRTAWCQAQGEINRARG